MFRTTTAALVPLAAALCWPNLVSADDPPDQNIRFQIHTDPGDPDSPVFLRYDLHLIPWKVDGNDVSWLAATVQIARLNSSNVVVESWTQSDVPFATDNGFWTISHQDAGSPVIGEFLAPPQLTGTAVNDGSGPTLTYSIEASTNTARTHPYTNTSFLVHSATRGTNDPIDPNTDDPTEAE